MSQDEALAAKEEGNLRMKAKDWNGAVASYSKAIELDANNHVFYSNRCVAFLRLDRVDDAVKDAEKCLSLAPEWPKSYLRMAHALTEKKQYDDAVEMCTKGLEHDPENSQLMFMRGEAKKHKLVARLLGRWHGSVPPELGGYEQELDFKSADKVVVHVFEKSVETRMRIDAEKEPVQMDLSVPDAGAGAQDIYYICKIEDDVLHLCSPTFEKPTERPTVFEGPSHVTLKRGPKPAAVDEKTREWLAGLSVEQKQEHYILEALKIFPGERLLPLQTDSEQQRNHITLLNIKFQSENYKITAKFGADIEAMIRDYLLAEKEPPTEKLKDLVTKLKLKMQEAMLLPPDAELAEFRKEQRSVQAAQAAQDMRAKEAKEVEKVSQAEEKPSVEPTKPSVEAKAEAPAVAAEPDSVVTSLVGLSLVLAAVSVVGYFLFKRND